MKTTKQAIMVPTAKGMEVLLLADIVRIQGQSNYCIIFFNNGRHTLTVARLLKHFEQDLPMEYFIRPHRTHIINKHFIKTITLNGHSYITMTNGEKIAISRRKKHLLQNVNGNIVLQ